MSSLKRRLRHFRHYRWRGNARDSGSFSTRVSGLVSRASAFPNFIEDMSIKKTEGQIGLPIGRTNERAQDDNDKLMTGPVPFSDIIDKNRVSAAKLKQFHEFGVDMDQKEEVGKGITTLPSIPDLKIDIDQERSKGRLRFG
jgi:hypothetical protein